MFRRRAWFPVLILAVACGGTNPPPPEKGPTDIPPGVAGPLGQSLQSGSSTLAASDSLASLSAELAALAIQAGVQVNDVSLTASLRTGPPDRAALTTGAAQAFGFQIRVLNRKGASGPETFSGVLAYQTGTDWVLAAGPSPGSGIPPALGLLGSGGQVWKATAGNESAQLQTEGSACRFSLPAAVTSCKSATFTSAGFSISASSPVSTGATGSKTASMTTTKLSGGISLVVDCNIGSVCPGSGPQTIAVHVSPSTATVASGGTLTFQVQVDGTSNHGVTWSVDEPGGGSITTPGGVYTAPNVTSNATYHVRATSVVDTSKFGEATVNVTAGPPPPPITVTVSPNPASLAPGGMLTFHAQVGGTSNNGVTWSVDEAGGGSITTPGGVYTAPNVTANATYHVRATSVVDTSKFGEATVNVTTAPSLTINQKPASTTTLGTIQFTATVNNLGSTSVTWSIDENTTDYRGGHIDSSGNYTAPAGPGTFTVRARAQANSNVTDTSTVTVNVGCMEALAVIHPVGSQTLINMVGKVPLQVDSQGRPVVVWVEYGPYTAYVARYEDNGWHQLGASLPSGGFGGPDWVDLVIDDQDRMAVGYEVFNSGVGQNEIHVALWDAGVWNGLPAVPQGLGNNGFALQLDGAGHPVVALARNLQSNPFRDIAVAQWTGSGWNVDGGIYATATENVSLPALIIDLAGDITVAWEEAQPPVGGFGVFRPFVKKLTGPGAGFLPSPRPDADYYEGGPALAFDKDGKLTMAWSNFPDQTPYVFSDGLEVTTWNGSTWSQVGNSLPGLPSVVVPEHNGTPFNPHRLMRNPETKKLAAATMATVNDLAAVYEQSSNGSWPMLCAEMHDATQADDLAKGNELTGLAYDAKNHAYVLASTSGAGTPLFVARIKQAQ